MEKRTMKDNLIGTHVLGHNYADPVAVSILTDSDLSRAVTARKVYSLDKTKG